MSLHLLLLTTNFKTVDIFSKCKINIGLNIVNKREDGYHELETLFFPIGWQDVLEIIPC